MRRYNRLHRSHMKQQHNKRRVEKRETILESVITTTGKGVGFIRHESVKELVRIEQEFLKTSLHGDRVAVRLLPSPRGEKERRGGCHHPCACKKDPGWDYNTEKQRG